MCPFGLKIPWSNTIFHPPLLPLSYKKVKKKILSMVDTLKHFMMWLLPTSFIYFHGPLPHVSTLLWIYAQDLY